MPSILFSILFINYFLNGKFKYFYYYIVFPLILFNNSHYNISKENKCSIRQSKVFDNCDSIMRFSLNKRLSDAIISAAISFMGQPYKGNVLDIGFEGQFWDNLCEFDCVTFIENSISLGISEHCYSSNYNSFYETLKLIRYRNGNLLNYCSRLHYFSEWITDNEMKGILTNITSCLGGVPFQKKINFISSNRSRYSQLNDTLMYNQLKKNEENISKSKLYFIPKDGYYKIKSKINNGDIIAFTSNLKNLDISHVGFAIYINTKLHLLHASKSAGKVEITKKTLHEYLISNSQFSGIMVSRVHF